MAVTAAAGRRACGSTGRLGPPLRVDFDEPPLHVAAANDGNLDAGAAPPATRRRPPGRRNVEALKRCGSGPAGTAAGQDRW